MSDSESSSAWSPKSPYPGSERLSVEVNIFTLISEMEVRPILWDGSENAHKNRNRKRVAWEEVFQALNSDYENLSSLEKSLFGKYVQTKWKNVRDAFVRNNKFEQSLPVDEKRRRKRYIYEEQLAFLKKILNSDSSAPSAHPQREIVAQGDAEKQNIRDGVNSKPKKAKSVLKLKDDDLEKRERYLQKRLFGYIDRHFESRMNPVDEDEAFFASLLPSIKKFNEDQKLEFRAEVLNLVKRIKQGAGNAQSQSENPASRFCCFMHPFPPSGAHYTVPGCNRNQTAASSFTAAVNPSSSCSELVRSSSDNNTDTIFTNTTFKEEIKEF